jgi:glycosyltransferase involved in cell wall biosynthesis
MSFTDLLTIAIPCYERKDFFKESLESALNQSIKCKVIVIDNCSTHDYFEKLCKKKGATYYRNDTNIGLYPNLNRCYELAESEYVKVLDDDDVLSVHYVESFLKALSQYPEIDVYFTDYLLLTSNGEAQHKEHLPFGYIKNGKEIIEYGIKYRLAFPYMTSAIRRRKAYLDIDIEDCVGGYDYVWVYTKANHLTFYGNPEKLHFYRIHDGKASHMDKDWVANVLTSPYIYETILRLKIEDKKLKKMIDRNIFWRFILLKSFGKKTEILNLKNSKNRFGKYLNKKNRNNFFLKILLHLPQKGVRVFYKIYRKLSTTA